MEDVHGLRVFQAVAQHLSFTRAAEGLFLTQSAVSHQVAALERSFGVKLLERGGRAVSLTPAGQTLLEHARRVFAAMAQAEAAVRAAARPDMGTIRIGGSSTACQHLIPEPLREFRECFPAYTLSVLPGDSPIITERLLEGTIDLGLIIRPERRAPLACHDLFADDLGVVVNPLHPWARTGRVDRGELQRQRLVLYSRASTTFRTVERHFLKLKIALSDFIELGSMEAIKELVKLGLGATIMAEWIIRPEVEQGSLVWLPLPGGRLRRHWCVAAAAGRDLSLAEQTFVGLCKSAAEKFG